MPSAELDAHRLAGDPEEARRIPVIASRELERKTQEDTVDVAVRVGVEIFDVRRERPANERFEVQ